MKRSMCGIVLLAAATALWSCNGDPTEAIRDEGQKVLAEPTSVFVDQGATEFVTLELVDGQGNQLETDFTLQNIGAGIAVEEDTTFLQTSTGHINTSQRFIVSGLAPGSTSFDVTSGGETLTIPVRVVPTSFAIAFSNAAPAANEPVTITLPAGYKFAAGAGGTTDQGPLIVQSFTADSTGLVVLVPPGSTGAITIDSVHADFLPGVTLAGLPSDAAVTAAPVVPQAGTGATGTAPALPIPAIGQTVSFYDGGTYDYLAPLVFAGVPGVFNIPSRLYRITVPADVSLTTTVDWPSPEDLGLYFFQSNGTTLTGAAGDAGGGGAHPETATNTLTAGTYFMAVVNFSETNPPWFALTVTAAAPPAP
jgi:hypothetical protein